MKKGGFLLGLVKPIVFTESRSTWLSDTHFLINTNECG